MLFLYIEFNKLKFDIYHKNLSTIELIQVLFCLFHLIYVPYIKKESFKSKCLINKIKIDIK